MALRHHSYRASCEPTIYQRLAKARHATREGGHGSQDELRAGSSACDGNRLLCAGPDAVLRRHSAQATSDAKSIAVLPLVNTSGDTANDYFSDGLSEEFIAVLAQIPSLKIIGRSSSFLFKVSPTTAGRLARSWA